MNRWHVSGFAFGLMLIVLMVTIGLRADAQSETDLTFEGEVSTSDGDFVIISPSSSWSERNEFDFDVIGWDGPAFRVVYDMDGTDSNGVVQDICIIIKQPERVHVYYEGAGNQSGACGE